MVALLAEVFLRQFMGVLPNARLDRHGKTGGQYVLSVLERVEEGLPLIRGKICKSHFFLFV